MSFTFCITNLKCNNLGDLSINPFEALSTSFIVVTLNGRKLILHATIFIIHYINRQYDIAGEKNPDRLSVVK